MVVRPMRSDDVEGVVAVCHAALWHDIPGGMLPPDQRNRIDHLLATDPGGAWVTEHEGRIAGVALALIREGVWGLSLLALDDSLRGKGAGRALLAGALAYGEEARGGVILSSTHPAAMRLYANAGFDLRPCVELFGLVTNPPAAPGVVRAGRDEDEAWMAEVARAVRGASYGTDVPRAVGDGSELQCVEGRGFMLSRGGRVNLLAATDDRAAAALLRAHLAAVPAGQNASLGFLTSGQDWAIRIGLAAGLALSPDGPIFTRGRLGSLRPWLPSGPYL